MNHYGIIFFKIKVWFNLKEKSLVLLSLFALVLMSGMADAKGLPDFTVMVKKYGPAVVNISTIQKAKSVNPYYGRRGEDVPDVFRYFFGEGYNVPPQDKKSLGSGFIISADGYVLTNAHVIKDADEILVRLQDRRELTAEVIGFDAKSDLALLKIEAEKLPLVKLGRSESLMVGEWVLAIGSPFGFEASATKGIVSHIGRSLPRENYVPFIQTDVPINPGNSGGPLFNLDGEVIGINSQIYSRTGGFMGLSFAIPIDVAMNVVDQLKRNGKVQRGWLGVIIQEVNRDLADSFGLDKTTGALVAQVLESSPASDGGIKEGDVILSFGGHSVEVSSDLPIFVGAAVINSMIDVEVLRNNKKRTIKVRVGALPEDDQASISPKKIDQPVSDKLGLVVEPLGAEETKRWQLSQGVSIRKVIDNPALEAGLKAGDIITMVNNRDVQSLQKYAEIVKALPQDKWIPVLVYRQGNPVFIPVHMPQKE